MSKNAQEKKMALNERQNTLLQHLKEHKRASVRSLAELLYVSEATVRRDLQELQKMGLAERSHGGALLPENAEEVSMFFRMNKNAKEKEIIAMKALSHLPPFRSVFIDSSSTALALAERMELRFKTVVTNGVQTATQLSKKSDVNLILLGGNMQYNTTATTGSFTTRELQLFRFDLMICSCAAITKDEVLERSVEQMELKSTAFSRSDYRMLLADNTKFQSFGTYCTAKLCDFDIVVSDKKPPCDIKLEADKLVF